jgi:NCAIR mutase (PurE)-related protein
MSGPHAPVVGEEATLRLLKQVASGKISVAQAADSLRSLPFEDAGCAMLDHHRALRKGFPEVVYCAGKTDDQVADIFQRLAQRHSQVLGTRATMAQFDAAKRLVPDIQYHPLARTLYIERDPDRPKLPGIIVAAAGTSDLPVAEEAAMTLEVMGHAPQRIFDIGVAGLHRLLHHLPILQKANVIIAAAGMEGALPSVIAGLVSAPVIAVPTSVGYGASFHGLAALLAMLNSCASGITVVNIDNGFGAAYAAAIMNRRMSSSSPHSKQKK